MVERAKYDVWKNLGKISKEEAMAKYIGMLAAKDANWDKPTPKL